MCWTSTTVRPSAKRRSLSTCSLLQLWIYERASTVEWVRGRRANASFVGFYSTHEARVIGERPAGHTSNRHFGRRRGQLGGSESLLAARLVATSKVFRALLRTDVRKKRKKEREKERDPRRQWSLRRRRGPKQHPSCENRRLTAKPTTVSLTFPIHLLRQNEWLSNEICSHHAI